jgi:putative ABC transport system permease protein
VGEIVQIQKRPFRISGIFQHGKGGRKLVPIETLGELTGSSGKTSAFYLKLDSAANTQAAIDAIHQTRGFEQLQIMTMEEWFSLLTPDHIPALTINVVIGIAVIIGFLVIFQAMYTSVLERTREIGILKSMGASRATIVSVVLRETALLALAGVALGIAASFAIRAFLNHRFPTLYLDMSTAWVVRGSLIAFAGSLLGAFYPAWMAARKDPIDALAYE